VRYAQIPTVGQICPCFAVNLQARLDEYLPAAMESQLASVREIFPDFAAALAACGPGYNNSDIANVIAYKTALPVDQRQFAPEQAINSILAVRIAAAEIPDRPLTVLDFCGGGGFHYFRVVPTIRTPLRWAIVETPTSGRTSQLKRARHNIRGDCWITCDDGTANAMRCAVQRHLSRQADGPGRLVRKAAMQLSQKYAINPLVGT
jgi:hypothetical protein